jgi:hypothetical protein
MEVVKLSLKLELNSATLAVLFAVGFLLVGLPFGAVAARVADSKHLSTRRYFLLGEFIGVAGIIAAKKAPPGRALEAESDGPS